MSNDLYKKNINKRRVVPYVPEHKRLNVSPIEYPLKDPDEFARNARKINAEKDKNTKNKYVISLVQAYRDGKVSKEELESVIGEVKEDAALDLKHNVKKENVVKHRRNKPNNVSAIPFSGQNEDHLWTKSLNEDQISEKEINDDRIDYDSVPTPPSSRYYTNPAMAAIDEDEDEDEVSNDVEEDVDQNVDFVLTDVAIDDYVLLHNDNVLDYGAKDNIITSLINTLDENPNISLNSLTIFKRVKLTHGFHID